MLLLNIESLILINQINKWFWIPLFYPLDARFTLETLEMIINSISKDKVGIKSDYTLMLGLYLMTL